MPSWDFILKISCAGAERVCARSGSGRSADRGARSDIQTARAWPRAAQQKNRPHPIGQDRHVFFTCCLLETTSNKIILLNIFQDISNIASIFLVFTFIINCFFNIFTRFVVAILCKFGFISHSKSCIVS